VHATNWIAEEGNKFAQGFKTMTENRNTPPFSSFKASALILRTQ
jgi:hypothetical protein